MKNKTKTMKLLCIALVLILVGSIGAALLQTNFLKVRVEDVNVVIDGQTNSHALFFIPKEASAEHKVPVVVTCHGWLNSAEVQDAACIELSRRGIAVLAIDETSHGLSDNDMTIFEKGMVQWVEYVSSDMLDFVDTSKIGLMGHSMGGVMTTFTMTHYYMNYLAAIEAAQAPDSQGGEEITEEEQAYADAQYKISAALPTGNGPDNMAGNFDAIRCNYGILFGRYEEGGYTYSTGKANVLGAVPETLDFIHTVDPTVTSVEDGKYYGDKDNGTLRVFYQPIITHPLIHFDTNSTARVIEFFTYCWDINTPLTPGNQFFLIKEICNLVAMIGLFMLLVPMVDLLLKIPCFESLRGTEGPMIPALSAGGKKKFWIGWVLGGVVSFLAAVAACKLTYKIPWANNPFTTSDVFPAPAMNVVGLWTLFSFIWGAIWFSINYKKDKTAGIRNDEMIGIKISGKALLKTIGLAVTVMGLMYVIVWFTKWFFNTDFRFWTPAIKTFNPSKLIWFAVYLPVFFTFYFVNSLNVNGANRLEGWSEKKSLLISAIGNILGVFALWLMQYGTLVITGHVVLKAEWCDVLVICFCIWQLFLAPFLLRKFYKLTGTNWFGPLLVSSIYVLMGIANTATHTQLF